MPEDMPDRMPEDMPDRMPEDMPDRMPEDMSDRMPEDLPVTKCINVMVGITRSKVFLYVATCLALSPKIPPGVFESCVWALQPFHENSSPTSVGQLTEAVVSETPGKETKGPGMRVQSRGPAVVAEGLRMSGVSSWDRNPGFAWHA